MIQCLISYLKKDDYSANKHTDALQKISNHVHKCRSNTSISLLFFTILPLYITVVTISMAVAFFLPMVVTVTMGAQTTVAMPMT